MHTIKITPNLLFECQCTSGKFIRLPNRIELNRNFFCPDWNALVFSSRFGSRRPRDHGGAVVQRRWLARRHALVLPPPPARAAGL